MVLVRLNVPAHDARDGELQRSTVLRVIVLDLNHTDEERKKNHRGCRW